MDVIPCIFISHVMTGVMNNLSVLPDGGAEQDTLPPPISVREQRPRGCDYSVPTWGHPLLVPLQ